MKAVIAIILTFVSLNSIAQQSQSNNATAIHFIENKGQWDENILFKAEIDYASIYLERNCITFDLVSPDDLGKISHPFHHQADTGINIINKHCYKLWFEECNTDAPIEKTIQSRSYNNYFIGKDQSKWASKVYSFAEITYKEIYPGIDLKIYSRGKNFKYDFIVHPGADIKNIKLRYEGLDNIYEVNNTLQLSASFAKFSESEPVAYVQTDFYTLPVQCKYILQQNVLSFYIPQLYDKNYPLVIDPELIFGSYTGSDQDNWGYTATYDTEGNLYGGGIVFGNGYPTTTGAYQTSFGGGDPGDPPYDIFDPYDNGLDIGISKFSSDGTSLIYSTYLGGDGNELPHSMIVNSTGELIIYGTTGSENFPTTTGAYDDTFNGGSSTSVDAGVITFPDGIDIIVAKLSADGTALSSSTLIGGTGNDGLNLASATNFNYGDIVRGEVIVDESNNVYVASSTYSTNFPTTSGVFQSTNAGGQDGCIFKLNPSLSSLLFSTYIGGTSADGGYSLKRNSAGKIYVCGGTASSGFPATSDGWFDSFQGGTADGWIAGINSTASTLENCSFIGTSSYDQAYFVEVDDDDFVYVTGQSKGSFPIIDAAYSESGGKQYIAKLYADLSAADYSMVFGSGSSSINISPSAFLVDDCQNVYVSGWGGTVNNEGSTSGMTTTADALDATTDGSDFYFFVLKKNADDILFGSFFGGSLSAEHVDGGTSRFDKSGTIYQGVCAGCGGYDDFPTTSGAWSESNGSMNCNLGVGKIKLDLSGVYAVSEADPSISGCAPFTVLFENLSSDAEEYIWDFGDGSAPSTAFEPTHTFTDPGTYTVELVVIDSTTCNIADTSYLTIEVSNGNIVPDIDYTIEQDCDSLILTTINNSEGFTATEYFWSFGDGTTSTLAEPSHTYYTPGTYLVQFIITDSTSCNESDTIEFEINYLNDFNTGYSISTDGCLPVIATFHADFDDADAYFWDLGDGTTATTQDVVHEYFIPGTYAITLTITYCGYTDVYNDVFTVFELPTAYFDPEPSFGIANAPTTFINLSENAATYLWEFSDGTTSTEVNPVKYFPGLGNFEVCLTAYNLAGCPDTYCRDINIENAGAADIPTGFSPNGDGSNDVLFVKGFGFANMHLQVFNRWGQLVFETYSQKIGWDGTYKGKPLDMDVFVYKLIVDFTDGNHFEKTGNVTLIR
ncbi:MAG: PKD domain-containing protein [Chitinophagales bacterium]